MNALGIKGRNTSLLNFSFVGVGGQNRISHHNHVSFKGREHLVFQPDLTHVERGKCLLYFFFLVTMIVIPIKQLKEDGISSCVYHGDKVGNTLKLPKGG